MSKKALAQTMSLFAPIVKVDAVQRMVYGCAAVEEPDKSGEIFDYESSKPLFEAWSAEFEKATDGKSLGNVRAMHGAVAAGKLTSLGFDDVGKGIPVAAKIIDDVEWAKVMEGVYTGFSIGGDYVKRWKDEATGLMRYTAKPAEVSIVDNPCIPGATFTMVKAEGVEETVAFKSVAVPGPAPAPVGKDAGTVIAVANDALASLKALVAEMALMPGEPDTWTLDGILSAIRATVSAKASAEGAVADDAIVAADGGAGTPVTASPETGSAQGTPAAKVAEPAAAAPVVEPTVAEPTVEKVAPAPGPTIEETLTKIVAAPLGEVRDLLTKLVTLQEAGGLKAEGLTADLAKVTKSVDGIGGRLAAIEKRPAPIGRPAQKVIGSGDPEPGQADIGAVRKAIDTLAASGQLSPVEEQQARILLATVEARKL